MAKHKAVLIFLLLIWAVSAAADTLPTANTLSIRPIVIYENTTTASVFVTVQVTDERANLDSRLTLNPGGKLSVIPDGTTKAVSFTVPPAGTITLECNGTGTGGCKYTIAVH
jgi:hypothetical protein